MSDGRGIDKALGTLSGEGSGQRNIEREQDSKGSVQGVFKEIPSRTEGAVGYYNQPVLKQPVWIWSIPLYFYIGGVTGTAMTLGAAALALERKNLWRLVSMTRWIGMGGGALSAALLIHDLGRPMRFLYMLRVFRPSSPMSIGSWVLTVFSSLAGMAALCQKGPAPIRLIGNLAHYGAGVLGLALSGYTAVLLANTAMPIWQLPRRSMPFLFLGSAAASAASVFDCMKLNPAEMRAIRRFGLAGKGMELIAIAAFEYEARKVEQVGKPLRQGVSGLLWQTAKVCAVSSLILSALPGESRAKRTVTGVIGTIGGLCLRFGVFHMGKASARDPQATFSAQRLGAEGKVDAATIL